MEHLILDIARIFAAALGIFIAWYIYSKKHSNQHMVCPIGDSCGAVTHSKFSRFFGAPVELLGILYYGAILLGYGLLLVMPQLATAGMVFALFALCLLGFLFSLYLTFIQVFTLRELCAWCITSAILTTGIFVISIATLGEYGTNLVGFLSDARSVIVMGHVLGMALGLGAATITDIFFFRFLQDLRISQKEDEILHTLTQVIWFALAVIVITGVGLYLPGMEGYHASSKFLLKMIVVLVIIVNGSILNLFVAPVMTKITFGAPHHHKEGELHGIRRIAFALGAVSITSWYTAFVLGSVRSIPVTLPVGLAVYGGLLLVAVTGSQIMERLFSKRRGPCDCDDASHHETKGSA